MSIPDRSQTSFNPSIPAKFSQARSLLFAVINRAGRKCRGISAPFSLGYARHFAANRLVATTFISQLARLVDYSVAVCVCCSASITPNQYRTLCTSGLHLQVESSLAYLCMWRNRACTEAHNGLRVCCEFTLHHKSRVAGVLEYANTTSCNYDDYGVAIRTH